MNVEGKVIFVTGANRGIGKALVMQALALGARKVYSGVRERSHMQETQGVPILLDVTDRDMIAQAAQACGDVDILINNAGIMASGPLLTAEGTTSLQRHMEVNAWSLLDMANAFAPILNRNGGGAIINLLSVLSWISIDQSGPYSASKAAAWAITNSLRLELKSQQTQVLAVHPGYVDTDMTDGIDVPKMSPEKVAEESFKALQGGESELVLSEVGLWIKHNLSAAAPPYLE
jgi:NAD(P)-dependent dehydrogenase (short-subunit alcohol dehydrogenase family)